MILRGDLGIFAAEWTGWSINGEELVPPHGGWSIRRDDALSVPLMHAQISALRSELVEARSAKGDFLEEQPTPDQWEFLTA